MNEQQQPIQRACIAVIKKNGHATVLLECQHTYDQTPYARMSVDHLVFLLRKTIGKQYRCHKCEAEARA